MVDGRQQRRKDCSTRLPRGRPLRTCPLNRDPWEECGGGKAERSRAPAGSRIPGGKAGLAAWGCLQHWVGEPYQPEWKKQAGASPLAYPSASVRSSGLTLNAHGTSQLGNVEEIGTYLSCERQFWLSGTCNIQMYMKWFKMKYNYFNLTNIFTDSVSCFFPPMFSRYWY